VTTVRVVECSDLEWFSQDSRSFVYSLTAYPDVLSSSQSIDVGKVEIRWRRDSSAEYSVTSIDIPKLEIPNELIRIVAG
jgi:hypothetical protein